MGEQRAASDEAVRLVDAQVVLPVRMGGERRVALGVVFGQVGLDQQIVRLREARGGGEQRAGAAHGEARRDGEAEAPTVVAVPALDEELARSDGLRMRNTE